MAGPKQLKRINVWADGGSYLGVIKAFDEPKLVQATGDWRGGGMTGTIKVGRGMEAMDCTITMGGHVRALVRKFSASGGTRLRLVLEYAADGDTSVEVVEIYLRGKIHEIDFGSAKPGDDTEHKHKVDVHYYRRVVDGTIDVLHDPVNGITQVAGVDIIPPASSALTG
ncbi:phage major tail tube protein [Novosphingobium umbonatum]|uniref:Phage major tail tube protein n=1 Tax=Novosphingobium umbonatum TaxID=1908524 RepID=A0A437N1X5_9SPHN|nr:phage major tail tube protein [Novosphingobium umbonatum]RVU03920.1 phage major tail tube protein [Novosphingobium umbonatum]